jgi:hypothetical protein
MSARRKVAMPPLLIRFWVGMMVLTAVSGVYTVALTRLHHSAHPWGLQLLWGADFGWDLNVFRDRFLHFRDPRFWAIPGVPLTYPAAVGVVFALLYRLGHPLRDYLALCGLGVAAWMAWLVRGLAAKGVARGPAAVFALTVAATCWPLWVLIDTANVEGLVAMVAGAAMVAMVHRRWWVAAGLIGIAGAMKIFPLVLLALLLSKRRYREFFGGIVIALAVTIASLAILGPSISEAQRQIDAGLRVVTTDDALAATSPGPDTNHSLYAVVRYAVLVAHHRHPHAADANLDGTASMLRPVYLAYLVMGALAGIAAYVVRIRRMPMLNQMLALTVCAVTLPPLSRDYTLLHLFVPFGLLCVYAADSVTRRVPGLAACFVCLAFIFTAGTYLNASFALAEPLRAAALVALFVVVLKHPFHAGYLDEANAAGIV